MNKNQKKEEQQQLEYLVQLVKKHFPQDIKFESLQYQNSTEYKLRKQKYLDAKKNAGYSKYIVNELERIFKGCHVTDFTDTEEYRCYEYIILLHHNQAILDDDIELLLALKGKREECHIFVSSLGRYYFYYFLETNYDESQEDDRTKWSFIHYFEPLPYIAKDVAKMRKFFDSEQYELVSTNNARAYIPNVEDERIERGEAKVFHCLFSDLYMSDYETVSQSEWLWPLSSACTE